LNRVCLKYYLNKPGEAEQGSGDLKRPLSVKQAMSHHDFVSDNSHFSDAIVQYRQLDFITLNAMCCVVKARE
jgi:hypothetical protein